MSEVESPVQNPDDGFEPVDPCVSTTEHEVVQGSPRTGSDPVDYGSRFSQGQFDPPRFGGGGSHFDPPGGGGGSYSDIF